MSLDEFFAFQEKQDVRYELVNGEPVRIMAGAKNVHNDIVINVIRELSIRLRGSGCKPFHGDGSVETYPGQIRRPDAGINCGEHERDGLMADEPRVIVEVLSPSTRDFDTYGKVEEYKTIASVHTIILVDPNRPDVLVWSRGEGNGWTSATHTDLDHEIAIRDPDLALPLGALYEGIEFPDA